MSITTLYDEMNRLYETNRGAEAEAVLLRHLAAAQAAQDLPYELAVRNEQAGWYRNRGDNEHALEVCRAAQRLLEAGAAAEPADEATTLLNIATAYRAAGLAQDALPLYHRAQALYAETLEPADYLYAALYNNMAQAYLELGQLPRAAELLAHALEVLKCNADTEEEIALTHSNIAVLYLRLGQADEAEPHLREALALSDAHPEATNRAAVLGALASLLHQKGELRAAVVRYRQAMEAMERNYGQNAGYHSLRRNCELACEALRTQGEELP